MEQRAILKNLILVKQEVSIKDDGAEKYVSAQNYATNYLASNIQSVKVTYTYMDY